MTGRLFSLECLVASHYGDFPCGWHGTLSPALIEQSPSVMKAYARYLMDTGQPGEAKRLLDAGLKRYSSHAVTTNLLPALALYAIVHLRLGAAGEAATVLPLLRDELSERDEAAAGDGDSDVMFAVARGGYLLGMSYADRLALFEKSAFVYMEQERKNRTLESLIEYVRLSEASGAGRRAGAVPAALHDSIIHRAKWDPDYRLHAALIAGTINRIDLGSMETAASPYYRLWLRLLALRASRPERTSAWERAAEELRERIETDYAADIELQAEGRLLEFERLLHSNEVKRAREALKRVEPLFALGLPAEYRDIIERCRRRLLSAGRKRARPAGSAAKPAESWLARCFGGFRLERKGAEARPLRWKRKKAQELFLYLLLRPGYAAAKEQAIDALLGELDPDKAANQLYVSLHEVRRVLQTELDWADGAAVKDGVVRLHERIIEEVDVEKYSALVRVADRLQTNDPELSIELYENAFELYEPLLPDVQYIDWLDRMRDELEDKQIHVVRQLFRLYAREGDQEKAERYCMQWCAMAPLDEQARQAQFRMLVNSGLTSEAKKLYYEFESLLYKELKEKPSPETRNICFRM
ncbi:BTAD domain-containing putative transcriptional regulator [Paenibacillus thermotolerans]|uniref:BTAD domain-containing putative transcriptional regulator n=1 Tax=Paenibacillus thermotolerans TaxID=3027807 RepID=UPI0023688DC2|nr:MULTISPECIES: BTAD domain-containing putative transcriptional regulator [unclassified Paenibacillus]